MHLPIKRLLFYKRSTWLSNNKNFVTNRTYEPQLRPRADVCTLYVLQILCHVYVHVCKIYFSKYFIPWRVDSGL